MSNSTTLVQFTKALSDETRLEILNLCAGPRISVSDIADKVGVRQPTATHHLSILMEAGLVAKTMEGKHAFYEINTEHLVSCCGNLMLRLAPNEAATKAVCSCCS